MKKVWLRLWSLALCPLLENACFFVFMGLTMATCIVLEPWDSIRPLALVELLADLYIVCALLCLLPRKVRSFMRGALTVGTYAVCLVDSFLYERTGAPMQPAVLQAIVATTPDEAAEAVHAYVVPSAIWSPVGIIIALGCAHAMLTLWPRLRWAWAERWYRRWGAPVLLACVPVCFAASFTNHHYMLHRLLLAQSDTELPGHIMDVTIKTGYYSPLHRLWHSWLEVKRDGRALDALPAWAGRASVDSCSYRSPNIVLIIGESQNRRHSSLYSYGKPTCPRAEKRRREGNLMVLNDVVTPWNFTTEALEHLFSLYCVGDSGSWATSPLVTAVMRLAGYHVTFISNQYVLHPPKNTASLLDTGLLVDSALSRTQFDRRNAATHPYDEGLLNDYDSLRQWMTKSNLTIFHLIGQHIEFADRVPEGWHRFKGNDYRRPDLTPRQRDILADYDNAILYGDYVTDAILKRFEQEEAIVLFLPDHGERAFDHCQTYGRSNSMSPNDVEQQYVIPMWIWMSDSYKEKHPDVVCAVDEAKNRPFMTDRLPHLLLGLAGIKTSVYRPELDLLHPDYDEQRPRLLRGKYEYRCAYD